MLLCKVFDSFRRLQMSACVEGFAVGRTGKVRKPPKSKPIFARLTKAEVLLFD